MTVETNFRILGENGDDFLLDIQHSQSFYS